jgi:hypothetical protein
MERGSFYNAGGECQLASQQLTHFCSIVCLAGTSRAAAGDFLAGAGPVDWRDGLDNRCRYPAEPFIEQKETTGVGFGAILGIILSAGGIQPKISAYGEDHLVD